MVTRVCTGRVRPPTGAVYVGRNSRYGQTSDGNRTAKVSKSGTRMARLRAHERAVRLFAAWLAADAQRDYRASVVRRLRGRRLACHCSSGAADPSGLPCHAEVLAALANEPRATRRALRQLREE